MTYVEILEECDKRALVIAGYQRLMDKHFDNFKLSLDIIHLMSERQGGITADEQVELSRLRAGVEEEKVIEKEIAKLLRTLRNAGE